MRFCCSKMRQKQLDGLAYKIPRFYSHYSFWSNRKLSNTITKVQLCLVMLNFAVGIR